MGEPESHVTPTKWSFSCFTPKGWNMWWVWIVYRIIFLAEALLITCVSLWFSIDPESAIETTFDGGANREAKYLQQQLGITLLSTHSIFYGIWLLWKKDAITSGVFAGWQFCLAIGDVLIIFQTIFRIFSVATVTMASIWLTVRMIYVVIWCVKFWSATKNND
eukprot:TRINITY_DN4022_c0_g1_i2.p1 TRINITY_DN4022_c0_g1~~TRINITY_DN4022_c0_g1_i2.p1  ORF type:complete len:163 (-),score=17.18 TRINITY_DN4022_c0_g1_i2:140-628(-)